MTREASASDADGRAVRARGATRVHLRLVCAALCGVLAAAVAGAQAPVATGTTPDSATPRRAVVPRSQRPSLTVQKFEFSATPSNEDMGNLTSIVGVMSAIGGRNQADARAQSVQDNLGRAVVDLLVARLLESGQFRVLERKALDAVLAEQDLVGSKKAANNQTVAQKAQIVGAKYLVTGAITKFSRSKQEKGGIGGAISKVVAGVGVSSSQTTYEIALTARIIETASGEVVTSMTTEGKVIGDKERAIAGIGGSLAIGALGGVLGSSNSGDRERKIFESLQLAVDKLVVQFVEAKDRGDVEP